MSNNLPDDALSRKVMIYVCADGTFTIVGPGDTQPIPEALPCYSTRSIDEAEQLRTMSCDLASRQHPNMPGEPWYFRAGFGGDLSDLYEFSAHLDKLYHTYVRRAS